VLFDDHRFAPGGCCDEHEQQGGSLHSRLHFGG
jgi:hypothetical protein